MISKLKCKLTNSSGAGIFHDSRQDCRALAIICNKLIDKVNELTDEINRLNKIINESKQ